MCFDSLVEKRKKKPELLTAMVQLLKTMERKYDDPNQIKRVETVGLEKETGIVNSDGASTKNDGKEIC